MRTGLRVVLAVCVVATLVLAGWLATDTSAQTAVKRSVTQGLAKVVVDNLYTCPVTVGNYRVSKVGTITATDGTVWTIPADIAFKTGPKGADLYNECTEVMPDKAKVSTDKVPVVEIDKDGEVVTGYLMADNYFELYVNGKLIAVDNTPYTPFNSVIVKFKVKRPYTFAVKLVDWEEDMGVGTEINKASGTPWYSGDGGFVAHFSDGTVTDSSWRAQSFYIAPLTSPDEVIEKGNLHDTTKLGRIHPHDIRPTCHEKCFAVHYPIPANWESASFDDSKWPRAYEYTGEDIGVEGMPGYNKYTDLFGEARWIWSLNLVIDNIVLTRKTVK